MLLTLVVPCYNEEQVLPLTAQRLSDKMRALQAAGRVSADSRVLFVDDGSRDAMWPLIEQLHGQDKLFGGVKLSRNCGHQNALLAGLMTAMDRADAVISMDADLQDDVDAVDRMLDEYERGADIVYGVRSSRQKDTAFKRGTAGKFYGLLHLLGVDIVRQHADYRLMSRRAVKALSEFDERQLFLRGLVPLLGFRTATVYYERGERAAGTSKYPLHKMLSFALDGVTSMSIRPLRLTLLLGAVVMLVSVGMFIWSLVAYILGNTVAGWTSIVASIWLIGGIQLLCLGMVGEYIGKIYREVKHRPRYIVEEVLGDAGQV